MPRNFSFKLPDELSTQIEAEVERKKITATDVIRQAVEAYFNHEKGRQNFEIMMYELIRTRAAMLRCFDEVLARTMNTKLSDEEVEQWSEDLLEAAGTDATVYLEQRKRATEREQRREARP